MLAARLEWIKRRPTAAVSRLKEPEVVAHQPLALRAAPHTSPPMPIGTTPEASGAGKGIEA